MTTSPYKPPQVLDSTVTWDPSPELKKAAKLHATLNFLVLAFVCVYLLLVRMSSFGDLAIIIGSFVTLGIILLGVITVFKLAKTLYSFKRAFLCASIVIIPFIGLFVLVRVNAKVGEKLKEGGYVIGLFGARAPK